MCCWAAAVSVLMLVLMQRECVCLCVAVCLLLCAVSKDTLSPSLCAHRLFPETKQQQAPMPHTRLSPPRQQQQRRRGERAGSDVCLLACVSLSLSGHLSSLLFCSTQHGSQQHTHACVHHTSRWMWGIRNWAGREQGLSLPVLLTQHTLDWAAST